MMSTSSGDEPEQEDTNSKKKANGVEIDAEEKGESSRVGDERNDAGGNSCCQTAGASTSAEGNSMKCNVELDENEENASGEFVDGEQVNLKNGGDGLDEVEDDEHSTTKSARVHLAKIREESKMEGTKDDNKSSSNTDSDSSGDDDEKASAPKKTLQELGIELGHSKRVWRVHDELRARQLGFTSPTLFTRDVTGSVNVVERFKLESKLECHNGCVNTLNFNASGDLLASGSDDLEVVVWDWARGKKLFSYESGHIANVFQAKFMPNTGDSVMVTCARDGQIRVGYLSSLGVCQSNKRIAQHKAPAHKLSIEPGSPHMFLTCGEDGHVIQVDLREENSRRKLLCRSENKKIPLYTISINPAKPQEFAVGGRDYRCRLYDRRNLHTDTEGNEDVLKEYCPHHFLQNNQDVYTSVTCLMYSYDGSELLVSYNDEDIYLFDVTLSSNAEYVHRYKGHRNSATVKGVNFYGTRSEFIVSGSDCGHIFFWDKETESVLQVLKGDEAGVVNCLEPHPLYPVLATSGLDHDVKIWTPTSQVPIDTERMKSVILENERERDDERRRPHDPIHEDLLWLMVNHMTRRRFYPPDSDSDDTSDEDSSQEHGERDNCYPS